MPNRRKSRHPGSRILEWLVGLHAGNILLLLVMVVPLGVVGFVLIEGLSWIDAIYQTTATISTVGFQDLVSSAPGRVFTIFFMVVGVGLFFITLSLLSAAIVEGRLRKAIGRRRMEDEIKELEDHIILCGYGRLGQMTGEELVKREVEFVIVENDVAATALAEERQLLFLHADATEEDSLDRAGIHRARGVISTLDSDASNVYVALTAKEMRPEVFVVTVARDPRAESKLRAAGADHVISPYAIGAVDMARRLLEPHVSEFLDRTRGVKVQFQEVAVRAGSPLVHVSLRDTNLRQRYGVTVVAVVKTRDENVHSHPDPDLELDAGDVLVAVGPPEGLRELMAECASPKSDAADAPDGSRQE